MAEVLSEHSAVNLDPYGAFLKDLNEKNITILDDVQTRQKIAVTRDPNATDEARSAARNDIIESAIRLIPFVLKEMPKSGVRPEEMIGQGFEVLNSCIDNWDPEFVSPKTEDVVKFSSYVTKSLLNNFKSSVTVAGVNDYIPVPQRVVDLSNLMRRARDLFMQEEHREPSTDEWYKRTVRLAGERRSMSSLEAITPGNFQRARLAKFGSRVRFGKKVTRGNVDSNTLDLAEGEIENVISDENEDPEENAIDTVMREEIERMMQEALQVLKPIERTVLEMWFGLGLNEEGKPKEPLTLDEIRKILGYKVRESPRQIKNNALRKLRNPYVSRSLSQLYEYIPDHEDIRAEEKKAQRKRYQELLVRYSSKLLYVCDRKKIIQDLARIRIGDIYTGFIDPAVLESVFKSSHDELEMIKKYEKDLDTSPMVLVKDLVDEVNKGIVSLKDRGLIGNNFEKAYWMKQPLFTMDEVLEECRRLRESKK